MTQDPKQTADKGKFVPPDAPRSFAAGEEDGYQTDAFSRNDAEGATALPNEDFTKPKAAGASSVEAKPDAADIVSRRAGDDAASRDSTPPPVQDGGVR